MAVIGNLLSTQGASLAAGLPAPAKKGRPLGKQKIPGAIPRREIVALSTRPVQQLAVVAATPTLAPLAVPASPPPPPPSLSPIVQGGYPISPADLSKPSVLPVMPYGSVPIGDDAVYRDDWSYDPPAPSSPWPSPAPYRPPPGPVPIQPAATVTASVSADGWLWAAAGVAGLAVLGGVGFLISRRMKR
jgi:hypothetical protein